MKRFHLKSLIIIALVLLGFLAFSMWTAKKIWHSGEYKIAFDKTWSSASLWEKERNFSAFLGELLVEIAKGQDFKVQIISTGRDALFHGLEEDRYDGVLSFLGPTSANQRMYVFSKPLYLIGPVVAVAEDSPIKSIQDLEGKTVAISRDTPLIFNLDQFPMMLLNYYDSPRAALASVFHNQSDAAIVNFFPAYTYTTGMYAGTLKVITGPLTKEGVRVIAKNNMFGKDLIEMIDNGMEQAIENQTYQDLVQKWGLFLPGGK